MMKSLCIVLLLPLFVACTTPQRNADTSCGDAGPNTLYFPARTFSPHTPPPREGFVYRPYKVFNDKDGATREWYSSELDFLEQTSLSCGAIQADEAYRLVWLRSFDPLVAIQLTRSGNAYAIDAAMGNVKRKSGKPLRRIHRVLSIDEWQRITAGLHEIDFWDLPPNKDAGGYFVPDPPDPQADSRDVMVFASGFDGARWIIEGRADRYHVVDRWSNDDNFIAIGRIFIELSGLKIPEEDIY